MKTEKRIAIIYIIILATIVGLGFIRRLNVSDCTKSKKNQAGCMAYFVWPLKSKVPDIMRSFSIESRS